MQYRSKIILAAVFGVGLATATAALWWQKTQSSNNDLLSLISRRTTIDFRQVLLDPTSDKVVLVNFWATWCGPCIQETPSLLKLAEGNSKIVLVSISEDDSLKDLRKFLSLYPAAQASNVYVIHDEDRRLARSMAVSTFPTSYVFDVGLKEATHVAGAVDWNSKEIQALIEKASRRSTAN